MSVDLKPPFSGDPVRKTQRAVLATVGLLVVLGGCAGPQAQAPSPHTVTVTSTAAAASASEPQTVADALEQAGATDWSVRRLADVALATGYLPPSASRIGRDADNFAYMAVLECRDVTSGGRSWEESYQEAVDTGASPNDALRMTQHLQHVFCPSLAVATR